MAGTRFIASPRAFRRCTALVRCVPHEVHKVQWISFHPNDPRVRYCAEKPDHSMLTRRHLVHTGLGSPAASALPRSARSQGSPLGKNRLVLLGTKGGPAIRAGYRPSPSANLIVYDGVPYVIDTGYGISFKLVEAKFPLSALRYCFHHASSFRPQRRVRPVDEQRVGDRAQDAARCLRTSEHARTRRWLLA